MKTFLSFFRPFRPLKLIAHYIYSISLGGSPYRVGIDWRCRLSHFGMALDSMSKGYQYDTRAFRQRLTDKGVRYHFAIAFGANHRRAQRFAGIA